MTDCEHPVLIKVVDKLDDIRIEGNEITARMLGWHYVCRTCGLIVKESDERAGRH